MPGKVNPTQIEAMMKVAILIIAGRGGVNGWCRGQHR
jgi:fumarate hydratase class II